MSEVMKKRLTNEDVKILVYGVEIDLKKSLKMIVVKYLEELLKNESYSAEESLGDWLGSPRMRVAKYLKGARKREGLTQSQLCKKIPSLKQSNLSNMEGGERPIPRDLIPKLAKALKVKNKMLDESKHTKK